MRGISKDDMLLGVSILRNKNLANIFYRLKLIEAYGTGIAFKITIFIKLYSTENIEESSKIKMFYTAGEQKMLVLFLTKETIKRADVERALSISQPMAVKHLKSLLDKDAIAKIGNGKNVQYRLK